MILLGNFKEVITITREIKDEGRQVEAFKTETPDLTALFEAGLQEAINQVGTNLVDFTYKFPNSASNDNVYGPNTQTSQPGDPEWPIPGDNVGWTSSFWTGILWLAYERTNDDNILEAIKIQVESFNNRIAEKKDVDTHDLGFLYSLSSVTDYKRTGNEESKRAGIAAADHLATRYIDSAGIVQAWGALDNPAEQGRMIIDCLMNLPLLHWATEVTGDHHYAEKAKSHAKQALKYIVRDDGTTFHTYFFDVDSGEAKFGATAQGASDDSCWARGQAWGIYGFTLSYLYSGDEEYLEIAKKLANYFLNRSPKDFIVYWDLVFTDGDSEERDSSSSAIAVCGLLELVKHLKDKKEIAYYKTAAYKILGSLVENYSGPRNDSKTNALLLEGVYSKPGNHGVNEANLWGDYFYIEALTRVLNPEWELYW